MTIFQILAKIFGKKKKKAVVKPIVFTPPMPTTTEDKNDFNFQVGKLDTKRKELGQLQADYNNYVTTGIFQTQAQKNARLTKYNEDRAALIKDIQDRAINLKRLFSGQINNAVKTYYSQIYGPIRKDINDNFNNILLGESYAMTFPIDRVVPVEAAPNVGATQTNVGATQTNVENLPSSNVGNLPSSNVGNLPSSNVAPTPTPTPTPTPRNDGTFPDWTNKSYTPNTTVYFGGHIYKTIVMVDGNNNNTPDKDGRWALIY